MFERALPRALCALLLIDLLVPVVDRWRVARQLTHRFERLERSTGSVAACAAFEPAGFARVQRLGSRLATWPSVGGCGASAATGGGGIKWVGRNVSGGLFDVQCQGTYSPLLSDPLKIEHHFVLSTLVTAQVAERWSAGVSVPFVYKYLRDPHQLGVDLSNSGLGDVSVQATRRLGTIGATALTASVGLPTGHWDTQYRNAYLRQHQQLGFGRPSGSLTLDHTVDEVWGLHVLGLSGNYRGGQNQLGNYRAPNGSAYAYTGIFAGRFVPALGVSLTGFTGHDIDRGQAENSAVFIVSGNLSLEWSNDWVAVLAAASLPYQYDGIYAKAGGGPKNPWSWGQWVVGLGLSFAPF